MVRLEGLEPPRRKAPEPKSGVSTNFTTGAYGAARGTRTPDPLITNQLLYQLS
jgi:hypothetical protein